MKLLLIVMCALLLCAAGTGDGHWDNPPQAMETATWYILQLVWVPVGPVGTWMHLWVQYGGTAPALTDPGSTWVWSPRSSTVLVTEADGDVLLGIF